VDKISVKTSNVLTGELFFNKSRNNYTFNYVSSFSHILLIMPNKTSSCVWQGKLHPVFDAHMPESYLFEMML
jgi:hypothetical protein